MTIAQARQAFRLHKTCESADVYLENTSALKTAKAIAEETFFNTSAKWLIGCLPRTNACELLRPSKQKRRYDPRQTPNGESVSKTASQTTIAAIDLPRRAVENLPSIPTTTYRTVSVDDLKVFYPKPVIRKRRQCYCCTAFPPLRTCIASLSPHSPIASGTRSRRIGRTLHQKTVQPCAPS
jgi:hypothetical protein